MGKAHVSVTLSEPIKEAAARLAEEDGVSLDHWIALAVAQKVGTVETAAEFFKRRANGRTGEGLDAILDRVPDRPPDPGDELPEGWTPPDWMRRR